MADDTDRQFWVLLTVFGGLFGTGLFYFFDHPRVGAAEVIVGGVGLASLIRDRIKRAPIGAALKATASIACIVVITYVNVQFLSLRSDVEAYFLPRGVSKHEAEQIRSALRRHPSEVTVDVFASLSDPEATEYAGQLASAIRGGEWRVNFAALNPWETGPNSNHGNGTFSNMQLALDQGVRVIVGLVGQPVNEDQLHPSPQSVLTEVLQQVGIYSGGGVAADRGVYSLIVEVGRRPREIRPINSMRARIGNWIVRNLVEK